MKFPTYKNETACLLKGFTDAAGCDEVGVGPIAGPVVAAACILDPACIGKYRSSKKWYYRVRDSKTTYEKEREGLIQEIKSHCICFGVGEVDSKTIDQINIHNAGMLAMRKAVEQMAENLTAKYPNHNRNVYLFVDGRFTIKELMSGPTNKKISVTQEAVIDGDALILSIAAASIIAKVHRDNILRDMDKNFPDYLFAKHKGYNTRAHRDALEKHGLTPFHRLSFLRNKNQTQVSNII